jgi:two-component system, OmpR family, sensor kinase
VRIADGLTTVGDEELLRRAVDNLLMNVLVHTPADAVGTITASAVGDHVTIEVSDDGPAFRRTACRTYSSASTAPEAP